MIQIAPSHCHYRTINKIHKNYDSTLTEILLPQISRN